MSYGEPSLTQNGPCPTVQPCNRYDHNLTRASRRARQPALKSISPNTGNAPKGRASSIHHDRERSRMASVGSLGFNRQVVVVPTGCWATNLRVPDSNRISELPIRDER